MIFHTEPWILGFEISRTKRPRGAQQESWYQYCDFLVRYPHTPVNLRSHAPDRLLSVRRLDVPHAKVVGRAFSGKRYNSRNIIMCVRKKTFVYLAPRHESRHQERHFRPRGWLFFRIRCQWSIFMSYRVILWGWLTIWRARAVFHHLHLTERKNYVLSSERLYMRHAQNMSCN